MPRDHDQTTATTVSLNSALSRISALEGGGGAPPISPQTVIYSADLSEFENPGRGIQNSYESDAGVGGGSGTLATEGIGSYTHRVARRYWYTPTADAVLPQSFLDGVATDCNSTRNAGKLIDGKFAYVGDVGTQPSWSRIQGHINQLLPVLTTHADVFRQLEIGWLGPWGETHTISSTGWTDSQDRGQPQPMMRDLVKTVMAGTPSSMWIGMRYPQVLIWMWDYGGLTTAEKARLAFYNDGHMTSNGVSVAFDNGTFPGAWNDGIDAVRRQWIADFGLTHPCRAESDLDILAEADWARDNVYNARYHSFERQRVDNFREWGAIALVTDYHGITAEVKRNLGYRLVMLEGRLPAAAVPTQTYTFDLDIRNDGYAPPRRDYVAKVKFGTAALVTATMTNQIGGAAKPTTGWVGGATTHKVRFVCTVPTLAAGTHAVGLELTDPNTNLTHNDYKIRLANQGTWVSASGRNSLLANVTVA